MMKRRKLLFGTAAVTASAFVPMARAQQVLTVGLIPSEDSRAMIANSQAMMDMLSKALGFAVKPFVAADYNGVIEALRSKRLDVAYLGPFSYVLGATVADIEAFAVAETKKAGRTFYYSQIVTHKDTGIKTVADLKGKTFAFVDPSSTSGHLFPKAGLMKLGFNTDKDFGRVIFSGSHDSSAIAVQNKKVDAAAIADRILDAAVSKGLVKREDLVEVWKSDPIPESPTVWRKDLPADLKTRVQAAFLQVKNIPWSDQGELNGFHPTNDAAYNIIRDTAKVLNLDLRKMK
ncbi:phosphonate transport system substrate-binding protein [Variovorax boronicumulans]|uniref:Phosphonate transport system substrate-binding protein n=2 Tax=Comamonadaceae TaxID=80864 RepID=A0AAW8CYC5_9BURK|nr:phosphonate transport system substrate-binding protein [Variovorax boronicumulans]MDP9995341.1 phosphonate transport system substrate-binding protein [Variovorax boronicumulans]MDQ0006631.1 phosphonate transport system substrate-binding protein [Variovorax boronicumulans]MDQ0032738.1 phosphonate transport system substrate-binding protein [Variovorax boronicumulans]MDQ0055519.1 phosphonate transport system substrate-binding protein [Variovorax boronicumulans]